MTNDTKAKDLLSRVSSDVSQLKTDIANLFSHTGRNSLPDRAREIADYGRDRLHAGGDYASSSLKYLRQHPTRSSVGLFGGLVLLGAVGAGIYYLCKSDSCCKNRNHTDDDDLSLPPHDETLPSYIS